MSELFHLVHESKIEALAELDDLALLFFDFGLRNIERRRDTRQLLAQRGELHIQLVDARQGVAADFFLRGEPLLGLVGPPAEVPQPNLASIDLLLGERRLLPLGGKTSLEFFCSVAQHRQILLGLLLRQCRDFSLEIGPDALESIDIAPQALDLAQLQLDFFLVGADDRTSIAQLPCQPVAFCERVCELCRQIRCADPQILSRAPLQGKQIAKLVNLLLQLQQRLVAPGKCLRKIELAGGEHQ